jgi:CBS domain-containing protein
MTVTIHDLLEDKGYQVFSVQPETTIEETLRLMAEQKIGFVPVMQEGTIVGVYSERDFARALAARDDLPLDIPIREVMVHPVYFIKIDQTIEDCMAVMTAMHFRHLPVLDGEKVLGVVSIGDVIKRLILEKEYTIEQLENLLWANLV